MEVILISDSAVKVMLTPQDLATYEITLEDLDEDNAACSRAFRKIMSEARAQTGFDPEHGCLSVQAYPCRSGGCELYVTVLDAAEEVRTVCHMIVLQDLATLLQLCRRLSEQGYTRESRAYTDTESRRCFLLLQDPEDRPLYRRYPMIADYGERMGGGSAFSYIQEHGSCICPTKAVQTLGKLT